MNTNRSDGWVKLYKNVQYSDIWQDPIAWHVFETLLCMAHFEDDFASVRFKGKQRYLKRGELSISRSELADFLLIPKSTIRDALYRLIDDNRIKLETDRHTTIISICNWKKFQPTEAERLAALDDNQTTTRRQPDDNQTDTKRNKEIKKDTNVSTEKSEFEKTIDDFKAHRKQLKRPMTNKAVSLLQTRLEKLAPQNAPRQIAILNQSIEAGWIGVFNLKEEELRTPRDKALELIRKREAQRNATQ